jgi:HSP20 family molecular chaperone IbpA
MEGHSLIKDDEYDYDDEDNVAGVVSIVAYKNDTYIIKTDLPGEDMIQLVVEVGDDLIEGEVEGLEDILHRGMTKH